MALKNDLKELLDHGIIDELVYQRIQTYYLENKNKTNIFMLIFGVIGAILVGSGTILLIAHNWDDYSNVVKLFFAFTPLVIGQLACAYSILKRPDSQVWKESAAVFVYFAIGACIALVAQIYNISGDAGTFILTWNLLSLPLVFILNSSINSLLVIAGLTNYAMVAGFLDGHNKVPYGYSLLVVLILPYYLNLRRKNADSYMVGLHNWFLAISALCVFPTLMEDKSSFLIIDYFNLFGLFAILGVLFYSDLKFSWFNSFKIISEIGGLSLLFFLSYDGYWNDSTRLKWNYNELFQSVEGLFSIGFLIVSAIILWFKWGIFNWKFNGRQLLFFIPFFVYCLRLSSFQSMVIINLIIFIFGLWTIRVGVLQKRLNVINLGLSTIALLIFLRFFDADISFVWRGIVFMFLGAGFFAANYFITKQIKRHEEDSK